jgi:pimeloyl-ACP methyl ester carboxylesterase
MKRIIAFLGVVCLLLTASGCESTRIVQAKTEGTNLITMELVGTGDQLVARKTIDLARQFTMADGTVIDAWVINAKTEDGKKPDKVLGTAVLLHGLNESKANYLGVGGNLSKKGYDVVLIDLRCHGRSTGKYITCGAKEKHDVKTVLDTLAKEKKIQADPIYVCGASFGGATAIQYAAIEPKVAGIVAIAAWKDTASKARRDVGLLMNEAKFKKTLAQAGKTAGFDPTATSALLDIPKTKAHVYLIHGLLDISLVPVDESQALFAAANEPKKLHIITPGPEQMALMLIWEQWLADQVDLVAKGKLKTKPKDSPAAKKAAPAPTPEKAAPAPAPAPEKAAAVPAAPAKPAAKK